MPIPDLLLETKGWAKGVNEALDVLQTNKFALANSAQQDVYNKTMQQISQQLQAIQDPAARARATGVLRSLANDISYTKANPLFEEAKAVNPYSMKNVRELYSQVRDNILLKQPIADAVKKHGKDILSGQMFKTIQHLNG